MKMNGPSLLEEFRTRRCEAAFAALVRLYAGLIFSTARRRVGNAAQAEDVSQAVFLQLAQSPPRVTTDAELAGWLHRTTLHLSIDQWRSESRRRAREIAASTLMSTPDAPDPDAFWSSLAPHLDDAVDELPDQDRRAILLRFFERKSMRDLGDSLGVSEAAAKMRVARALEKLRPLLQTRGIFCGGTLLGTALGERACEPVPETALRRWMQTPIPKVTPMGKPPIPGPRGILPRLLTEFPAIPIVIGTAGLLATGWVTWQRTRPPIPDPGEEGTRVAGTAVVVSGPGVPTDHRSAASRGSTLTATEGDAEEAQRNLRELLRNPLSSHGYPPPLLVRALGRFGNRLPEAMPILVDAAVSADPETRLWAISGIGSVLQTLRKSGNPQDYEDALALSRPTLGGALMEDRSPDMLKVAALLALAPPVPWIQGKPDPTQFIDTESLAWIERALHKSPGSDTSFRFSIVDHLIADRAATSAEVELVRRLAPKLESGSQEERLLAAYALATAPGDKPGAVKAELLRALAEGSPYGDRAARAMAALGEGARDTVPVLLAFAERTADWADGGYARSALESACKLQPELRASYPEIDKALKAQEQAHANLANSKGFLEQTLELAALGDDVVLRALTHPIQQAPDAATARQRQDELNRAIQDAFDKASPQDRAALQRVQELVQNIELPPENAPVPPPKLDYRNLLLEARVLLQDDHHPNGARIEEALERFQEEQRAAGAEIYVTGENFAALSKLLDGIDPQFRADWQAAVLRSTPGLDHLIPKSKP